MSKTCQVCGGAVPDGLEREAHTALCAAIVSEDFAKLRTAAQAVADCLEHTVEDLRAALVSAPLPMGDSRAPCTLENCGHMRQLSAIVDLLGMPRGTRSVLDELRQRQEWEDVRDGWTDAIKAAHPAHGSGSHDEYGTAMQMVGHRHSKGELVALVNWLLVRIKQAKEPVL